MVVVRKISEKIQSADVAGFTLAPDSRLQAPPLNMKPPLCMPDALPCVIGIAAAAADRYRFDLKLPSPPGEQAGDGLERAIWI